MDDLHDAGIPHFYPPSPASRSALQHCSTTEIQLASTSMTGIDGCPDVETSTTYDSLILREPRESGYVTPSNPQVSPNAEGYHHTSRISVLGERGIKLAQHIRERESRGNKGTPQDSGSEHARRKSSSARKSLHDTSRSRSSSVSHHIAPSALLSPPASQESPIPSISDMSAFPEVLSFIVPMEPLPSGTPVTKQLLAAKGIMRDSKTPGSGQSVRFFSRDTYCLDSRSNDRSSTRSGSLQQSDARLESEISPILGHALISPSSMEGHRSAKSSAQSPVLKKPADASMVYPEGFGQRIIQSIPSLSVEASLDVKPNGPMADVFGSMTAPVRTTSISAVGPSIRRSVSSRSFAPSPSACKGVPACPKTFETSVKVTDIEYHQNTTPSVLGAADMTTPPPSPGSSTQDSKHQHLPPTMEVITLDDSSDCSVSAQVIYPFVPSQGHDTIYHTPDTTKSQRKTTSPNGTPPNQAKDKDLSHIQLAAQAVFTAHERRLQVLCAERDGWKTLCEQLMTRHEAEMSTSTQDDQRVTAGSRYTRQETHSPIAGPTLELQRSLDSGQPPIYDRDSVLLAEVDPRAKNNIQEEHEIAIVDPRAKNNIQEELQDLQIRFEAKQRESEEERAKAEKWELMFQNEARVAQELRQDNERHMRDARDVDIRLELYARERENKVRQQLQAEIRSITTELDIMHGHCQTLKTALQRQSEERHSAESREQTTQAIGQVSPNDHVNRATQSEPQDQSPTPPQGELHSHSQNGTLISCSEALCNLEKQLQQAQQEQERATVACALLESIQQDLAKEVELNAELTSLLNEQEVRYSTLQKDLKTERDARTRESANLNGQIAELQIAYSDQVKRNHEQYLELEEAMDDREAKFSERIAELELICEQRQEELRVLAKGQSKLDLAESACSELRASLERTREVLAERESRIEHFERSNHQQVEHIGHQDEAIAALKRQAADDVFKSTKQERRIEKLLHDREMLNIAVEQLQIHIQLVKRQYKARTGMPWDDEAQPSPYETSRLSVAPKKLDHSISTPLGISKTINHSTERPAVRRRKELAR